MQIPLGMTSILGIVCYLTYLPRPGLLGPSEQERNAKLARNTAVYLYVADSYKMHCLVASELS